MLATVAGFLDPDVRAIAWKVSLFSCQLSCFDKLEKHLVL